MTQPTVSVKFTADGLSEVLAGLRKAEEAAGRIGQNMPSGDGFKDAAGHILAMSEAMKTVSTSGKEMGTGTAEAARAMGTLAKESAEGVALFERLSKALTSSSSHARTLAHELRFAQEAFIGVKMSADQSINSFGKVATALKPMTEAGGHIRSASLAMNEVVASMKQMSGTANSAFAAYAKLSQALTGAAERQNRLNESAREYGPASRSIEEAHGKFGELTHSIGEATIRMTELAKVAAEFYIADKMKEMVVEGVNYNREMESTTSAIAALLSMQAKISDGHGKMVEGAEKYGAAMEIAKDMVAKIKVDGMQTTLTPTEIGDTLRTALPMALHAGVTDPDKIRSLVVAAAKTMGALNINNSQEVRAELEGMFTGQKHGEAKLVSAMNITPGQIERWRETGQVYDKLYERLRAMDIASAKASGNFEVLHARTKEVMQTVSGEASKGLFDKLKASMATFLDTFLTKTGEISPAVRPAVEAFGKIETGIGSLINAGVNKLVSGIKEFSNWLAKNPEKVERLETAFGEIGQEMSGLISDLTDFHGTSSKLETVWKGLSLSIAAVRDGISTIGATTGVIVGGITSATGALREYWDKQKISGFGENDPRSAPYKEDLKAAERQKLEGSLQTSVGLGRLEHLFSGDSELARQMQRLRELEQEQANKDALDHPEKAPVGKIALPPPEMVAANDKAQAEAKEKADAQKKSNAQLPAPLPGMSPNGHPLPPVPTADQLSHGPSALPPGAFPPPLLPPDQVAKSGAAGASSDSSGLPKVEGAEHEDLTLKLANQKSDAEKKKAFLEDDLRNVKASNAADEQEEKAHYEAGLETLDTYFENRRKRMEKEQKIENALLDMKIQAAKEIPGGMDVTHADNNKRDEVVHAAEGEKTQLNETYRGRYAELEAEKLRTRNELQKQYTDAVQQMQHAQGDAGAVILSQLDKQLKALDQLAAKYGITAEQLAKDKAELTATQTANAGFATQKQQGQNAFKDINDQKAQLDLKAKDGSLFPIQAEQQLLQIERERIPGLQAISDEMMRQAQASGNQQQIEEAKAFNTQVQQLRVSTDDAKVEMGQFKAASEQAFGNLVEQSLMSVGQVHSIKDAFRSLALSAVQSLEQILAKMLAVKAEKALFGDGSGGGNGGFLNSLFGGGGGGGGSSGGGGLFSSLFSSGGSDAAAAAGEAGSAAGADAFSSMFSFFRTGGIVHRATGGGISGPGTGTSDSIPVMASNGEYIINAANTKKYRPLLEAINKGSLPQVSATPTTSLRAPTVNGSSVVGAANPQSEGYQGETHRVAISLQDGLVHEHLESSAGQRSIIKVLGTNKRQVAQLLK